MADNKQKVQEFHGQDVVIVKNPLNGLYHINRHFTDEERRRQPKPAIGMASDSGFEGIGYKTEEDAQYQIDNQADVPEVDQHPAPGTDGAAMSKNPNEFGNGTDGNVNGTDNKDNKDDKH